MRKNENRKLQPRRSLAWIIGLLLLIAAGVGVSLVYQKLHTLWIEQCRITDVAAQVTVQTGDYVKRDTILVLFGLKKGANLAQINFRQKHREVLERVPNIRELKIQRHLPNRVTILVEEREPIARMNIIGATRPSGRVVDAEGVVFDRQANTSLLPIIYEGKTFTKKGQTLSGRASAALELVKLCQTREFLSLGVLSVDTTHKDHLIATLGNYSRAKIAWPEMDDAQMDSTAILSPLLTKLKEAIRTGGSAVKVWTVTHPTRIVGDTKDPIL